MIELIDGAELCTETFGAPGHPPILLIMGMSASMIWWDDELCTALAAGGRWVIRYDHRDTGRSTFYPPGQPGYGSAVLTTDAVAVLDAYGIAAAHLVGLSMGGAVAQLIALDDPGRVTSLTLITTRPAVSIGRELPDADPEYGRFWAQAQVDWSDPESSIQYLIDHWRVLSGHQRAYDAEYIRRLATRDLARARNPASAQNHGQVGVDKRPRGPLASITAPTLVIHGTADPLFALEYGHALTDEIPGARLLTLDGAGHGLAPVDFNTVVPAIIRHTM
ncbi:MAG: alpha/beta fold hydrolase [Solirubrobacteraceae bacterium]